MYDVIILGGGPAGLSAGINAGRAKLKTLIIEKAVEGGQIVDAATVENYPGIEITSGLELGMKMKKQAEHFNCEILSATVEKVELDKEIKKIITSKGEFEAKGVILATGAKARNTGAPGEENFIGKGVSYCSTCDAAFYEDFDVYVIGGGDSAVGEALFISKFAKRVFIVHRRDELRANKTLQEQAFANEKIHFIWDTVIDEIKGEKMVKEMVLKNIKTNEKTTIKADPEPFGIFVFIGYVPETKLYEGQINMEKGYIITDDEMRTNIPGVYAAGDLRKKTIRQVITAASDGAIAGINIGKYIAEKEGTLYEGFKN